MFSFSVSQFKNGLIWLRDVTVKSLAPLRSPFHSDTVKWNDDGKIKFAYEHELFRPLGDEAYRISIERMVNQQTGVQVRDNLRLQWDVNQFRTVDDQMEVGIRLGIHLGFR